MIVHWTTYLGGGGGERSCIGPHIQEEGAGRDHALDHISDYHPTDPQNSLPSPLISQTNPDPEQTLHNHLAPNNHLLPWSRILASQVPTLQHLILRWIERLLGQRCMCDLVSENHHASL